MSLSADAERSRRVSESTARAPRQIPDKAANIPMSHINHRVAVPRIVPIAMTNTPAYMMLGQVRDDSSSSLVGRLYLDKFKAPNRRPHSYDAKMMSASLWQNWNKSGNYSYLSSMKKIMAPMSANG